ncbi:MAG: AAA family ATPase [Anaerolineae bacterium]|nr:AAA family ATPase [Thermoflexales bacterium]MDW8406277.1 AAA family ATPase [Anaerolineae bacterium]
MLRAHFLGRPQISRDGRPVESLSGKAIALLAYLAARRDAVTRDRLLDVLWPASAPAAARKNLRNTVWTLRKGLGEDVLDLAGDRLALTSALWVDTVEFERAVDSPAPLSLELYRGPFLDGLHIQDAADFEVWLTAERDRLLQLYLRAVATHIHAQRVAGNWQAVVELAQRALGHDPLHESLHGALMEAYARLGQRAEALRQYDVLRQTLARELGVEPLPETEALRRAIYSAQVGPTKSPSPIEPLQLGRRPVTAGERTAAPFVGRQVERMALDRALRAAQAGQARVALLAGEMGIGKSRLWDEWSAKLDEQVLVLTTRCLDATQALPFYPLAELLRRQVCLQRVVAPESPLAPVWMVEIARLLPELRALRPDLPPPATLPPDEERHHLFEALAQCFLALHRFPLVLFIDDAHWADHTTLDWLNYWLRRVHDQPVLVVLAYRPEDAGPQLIALISEWTRRGIVHPVTVSRLDDAQADQLIAALMTDPSLRQSVGARIRAQSGGNPYFLIELCRAAPDETPAELAALVQARLGRLPEVTRQVLQSAAVLDSDFDLALVRRVSGRSERETLDALDQLLGAFVLVGQAGVDNRYTFAHPLVAAVVRSGLSGARRAFLHRRAAQALMLANPAQTDSLAGRIARHLAEAGEIGQAADWFDRAAAHALRVAATGESVYFARQALALQPTAHRYLALAEALGRQGRLEEAADAYRAALDIYQAAHDQRGIARACLGLAAGFLPTGQGREIAHWVEKSLQYLDAQADPAAYAEAEFLLGAAELLIGRDLMSAERHLNESMQVALDNRLLQTAARSAFEMGNLSVQRGDFTAAIARFEETIRLAQQTHNPFQETIAHNNAAYALILAGRLQPAREHLQAGFQLAETFVLDSPWQWLYSTRGELALAEQNWDEAEEWFKRGIAEAQTRQNARQIANYQANFGLVARGRGDLAAALEWFKSADEAAARLESVPLRIHTALWLAELHIQRGELSMAESVLARAEQFLLGSERIMLRDWAAGVRARLSAALTQQPA